MDTWRVLTVFMSRAMDSASAERKSRGAVERDGSVTGSPSAAAGTLGFAATLNMFKAESDARLRAGCIFTAGEHNEFTR